MASMRGVELLFDYASPYAYLANERLGSVLPGVRVTHVPVYLRGFEAFSKGVPFTAPRLAYILKDLHRCAQEYGLPFRVPASFPVNGLYSLRGAIAARRAGMFDVYHHAMFRAVWAEGRETSTRDSVAQIMRSLGLGDLVAGLDDASIKHELRTTTEAAARRGVFGVPTFVVGDELFWGHDRMHQVARAALTSA
jgi:2-hydroxychromene-2-carboxylate isomerase